MVNPIALTLCAFANKEQTQITNTLMYFSTFRLTYFTQAWANMD